MNLRVVKQMDFRSSEPIFQAPKITNDLLPFLGHADSSECKKVSTTAMTLIPFSSESWQFIFFSSKNFGALKRSPI